MESTHKKYFIVQVKTETKILFFRTKNCTKKQIKKKLSKHYNILKDNILAKQIPKTIFSYDNSKFIIL